MSFTLCTDTPKLKAQRSKMRERVADLQAARDVFASELITAEKELSKVPYRRKNIMRNHYVSHLMKLWVVQRI